MPLRTEFFRQVPWEGGLNTRQDPALVPNNQLTQVENLVFSTDGARETRPGIEFFDTIAFALTQEATGTSRTIVFDRSLTANVIVGTNVSIFHANFEEDYDGKSFIVTALSTTNVTDDTVTYTHPNTFTETTVAASVIRIGVNDSNLSIVGLGEFFRIEGGGSQVRDLIGVASDGRIFAYDESGIRQTLTNTGTALGTITNVSFEQINNKFILCFPGTANTPKKIEVIAGSLVLSDLGGTPPNASIVREHLGRLFTNDNERPDRLHYSTTANPEEWGGIGDSAAIDIGVGDGDPEGIIGIYPTFKGELFVAKKTKLYRISGFTPETFSIRLVSDGIGIESHNSIVSVDQDDVLFMSSRGFHSLASTDQFGDFSSSFLSAVIQPSFNEFFNLERSQGVYLPELNSIAWAVNRQGTSGNSDLYFFNILIKEWYTWPNVSCEALGTFFSEGKRQLVIGTNEGRILSTESLRSSDFGNQAIDVKFKTGIIYPDNQPYSVKGFKKLMFMFAPQGDTSFTATVKIDNLPSQSVTYSQIGEGTPLGTGFTLGATALGLSNNLAPVTKPIDGFGHGMIITIEKSDVDEKLRIFGFGIEYEGASTGQDVGTSQGDA